MNNYKKQADFEQSVAAMRDAIPQLIEVMPYLAKTHMEYFKALKKEGFTDQQALYLVGAHGVNLGMPPQK